MLIRKAKMADQVAIAELIAVSSRRLSAGDYTPRQIEHALHGAFGLDTQLILDQTYWVVEKRSVVIACGGWSFRNTLFGSDDRPDRDQARLDPKQDSAKIRAFFVAPEFARQGIGSMILARCESEARAMGFLSLEMMATLPGKRLYEARGFKPGDMVSYDMGQGVSIEFVPMRKEF